MTRARKLYIFDKNLDRQIIEMLNRFNPIAALELPGIITLLSADSFVTRTIQGTANEVTVTNGDGVAGNPAITLPTLINGGHKFGDASNNTEVEADGTIHFNGNATVWKDIMFPQSVPKATGAGNPTLTTWNGGLQGYSYAVNDTHAFNPEEIEHDALVGSTATWHIHWISRSNDGTDRAVKWQLEYAIEPTSGAYPATTTISAEFTVPAGSAVNTNFRSDIGTFTIPHIARLVWVTIKRITASGTAPSVDPIVGAVHFHYEIDTVGSRQITTK